MLESLTNHHLPSPHPHLYQPPPGASATDGYVAVNLTVTPGDADERIFGLGQGDWNQGSTGCGTPRNKQVVVPLERNGPYEHTKSNHYPTGISVNAEDSHL